MTLGSNLQRHGWLPLPDIADIEEPIGEAAVEPAVAETAAPAAKAPRAPVRRGPVERDWLRRQSESFEGEARVSLSELETRAALDWFPQRSAVGKALAAAQGQTGVQLTIGAKDAAKFIDYYARRADRKRAEIGEPAIHALDSLSAKLTEAFGKSASRPLGTKVEGPPGPA